jgi:hypothetical protein
LTAELSTYDSFVFLGAKAPLRIAVVSEKVEKVEKVGNQ